MPTLLEILGFKKKRKKRGPNKTPSELTPEEIAYRKVRAARARAKRRAKRAA